MTSGGHQGTEWTDLVRSVWSDRAAEWDAMSEAHSLSAERTSDIARLSAALDLHHGSTLLDAGCGSGQFAIAFATLGCSVVAQDLAPQMIDRARVHAHDRDVSILFRTGDIGKLPDQRDAFDAIHARVVLQFVADPVAVLRGFRRVLRSGGRIFVSVPGSLSPIYNRSWRRFIEPTSVGTNFMVPWELQTLLEKSDWTILEQWGDFGQSLTGDGNEFENAVRNGPLKLRQASATTWGFIAQ